MKKLLNFFTVSALLPMTAVNAQSMQGVYYPPAPASYHGPSFFQGSSGPVVVPPTVITPPAAAVPQCRSKSVSFLFLFEMQQSGCN